MNMNMMWQRPWLVACWCALCVSYVLLWSGPPSACELCMESASVGGRRTAGRSTVLCVCVTPRQPAGAGVDLDAPVRAYYPRRVCAALCSLVRVCAVCLCADSAIGRCYRQRGARCAPTCSREERGPEGIHTTV